MNRHNDRRRIFGACALALLLSGMMGAGTASAAAAARDAAQVLACMRANSPPALRAQNVTMEVYEHQSLVRTLRGRLFVQRDKAAGAAPGVLRANLRITEPGALAGAAYLITQTQDYLHSGMYVYLPSVKRVRRVTGSVADGSLLGTQFSYNEFKQLQSAFGDLQATLEAPETLDGRSVERLSFRGIDGKEARYSSVRAWIDQQSCLPLKAEFYEGARAAKRLTAPASAIRRDGAIWYLQQLEMHDLRGDAYTRLSTEKASTGSAAAKLFDPENFYQVD